MAVKRPPTIAVVGVSLPPLSLDEAQYRIIHCPLLRIEPVAPLPVIPTGVDWVFWTSKQAIYALSRHKSDLAGLAHAVLGPAEAKALHGLGIEPQWQSPVAVGVEAAQAFAEAMPTGSRIWWPCGQQANPAIGQALGVRGAAVVATVVYHTVVVQTLTQPAAVDAWLFTSPSAVDAFITCGWQRGNGVVGAIGPTTAMALASRLNVTPVVAQPSGAWADVLIKLAVAADR